MTPVPATRRAGRTQAGGLLVAVVAAVVLVLAALPVPAVGPTLQVPGDDEVAVATLTGVDPAFVEDPDDVITLRGVVRNVSSQPLVDPLPALRLSRDALQSSEDLELVEQNPLFRYGRAFYDYSSPLDSLPPGGQASFELQVPLGSLVPSPGVYVVGVDVLATLPSGPRVFVASARTTVPVQVTTTTPVPTALIWPLAAQPSLLPSGSLLDDRLAAQIAPGGRLESLVRAGTQAPVTWVVDPDLLATVDAMADGYSTIVPPAPGEGADAAAGFRALLGSAIAPTSDVRRVPTADPDAGGMLASGLDASRVQRTLSVPPGTNASAVVADQTPALTHLVGAGVDLATLETHRDAGVVGVLVDPEVLRPAGTDQGTAEPGPGPLAPLADVPGLLAIQARTVGTASATGAAPALAARQRLLAETAIAVGEGSGPLVLAPPLRWEATAGVAAAVVTAWQQAPWVRPVGLSELPPSPLPVQLAGTAPAPQPLDPAVVAAVDQVEADLVRVAPLFPAAPVSGEALLAAQARAFSSAWGPDPAGALAYVAALGAGLADAESRVSLVLSPTITLSSRSGRFPVTLVNSSAADVLVGVSFSSQNTSRLRVADIPPTLLAAGEKRTVDATALATANGRVVVSAQLVTSQAQPVGVPTTTIIDVTDVGALGWAVVGAGGLLMAAAVVRARRRRRRGDAVRPAAPAGAQVRQ